MVELTDLVVVSETRKTIMELIEDSIQNIVDSIGNNPDLKAVVSTSGGKDSSVLASMFIFAIQRGLIDASQVIFTFADTKLEMPTLHKHITRMYDYATKLGIKTVIVQRNNTVTYWTRVLGDGSFTSNHNTRWCVQLLKLAPMQRFFKTLPEHIIATGIRVDESAIRKQRYEDSNQSLTELKKTTCDTAGECFVNLEGEDNVFHPILTWRNCDIWDFINFYDHGLPLDLLPEIYLGKETARLGCWNCTVVHTNQVVEEMGKTDWKYQLLYEYWRELIQYNKAIYRPFDWSYIFREGGVNNTTNKDKKMWRNSFIRLEVRKRLLKQLLGIQDKTGFDLISNEEVKIIKKKWETRHNHYVPKRREGCLVATMEEIINNHNIDGLPKDIRKIVAPKYKDTSLDDFFD